MSWSSDWATKVPIRWTLGARKPGGPRYDQDFALGVPFSFEPDLMESPRIGVVLHMFYAELAPEFASIFSYLDPAIPIMLTTDTAEKRDQIVQAFSRRTDWTVEVRLVENRGLDVGALVTGFSDRYNDFDLLVFLHSKMTPRSNIGAGWRRTLLEGLVGSDTVVRSIRAVFETEPRTGMVFCQHYEPIRTWTGWQRNFPAAKRIARQWGLRLRRQGEMDFPSGGLFWTRPAAIRPILDLGLVAGDFPPGRETLDGSISHAIERLYALAAERAGYTWFKVAAPECYEHKETIYTPRSDADLRAFLAGHERQLMKTMVRTRGLLT